MTVLLDTHAAMWSLDDVLSLEAKAAANEAAERGELLLSPVSAWEIGILVSKKRISLAVPVADYVRRLFFESGVTIATFTPEIALASTLLPGAFHRDPADRILVATASAYGAKLMTRDKAIHAYAKKTKHIRCIAC